MSFELTHDDILRSTIDIVNEDFDYQTFSQAFAPNWSRSNSKNNGLPVFNNQVTRPAKNDNLKTCPPMKQQVFNFEENNNNQEFPPGFNRNFQNNSTPESMTNIMNDNNVRNALGMINKNGVDLTAPILKIQVTGNPTYELTEIDILDAFSTFGNIVRIEVVRNRTAFVVYDDIITALFAQKSLNGQYVKHLDVKFYVSWSNNIEEDPTKVEEKKAQTFNTFRRAPIRAATTKVDHIPHNHVSQSMPDLDNVVGFNLPKFTCKYEIQLDNDKDFKIARKIIGPRGCNMKKIIEICQHQLKRLNVGVQSDFLKLRLRGRGSGFKEGPEQRESDDPLHLCVSSKHSEVYHLACNLVEDLLNGLYKEYEGFCAKLGRPLKKPVQIKRIEIYNTGNDKKEDGKSVGYSLNSIPDLDMSPTLGKSLSTGKSSNDKDSNSNDNSLSGLSDRDRNSSPESQKESNM